MKAALGAVDHVSTVDTSTERIALSHPDYEDAIGRAAQFRGSAVDGMCRGYQVRQDLTLRRKNAPR